MPNEKIVIFDYQNEKIYSSDDEGFLNIPVEKIQQVRLEDEIRFNQGKYEIFGQFYTGQYDRIVAFAADPKAANITAIKTWQPL